MSPWTRFSTRALVAAAAVLLVTVPFGLLLGLVRADWAPLLAVDADVRDRLNAYARDHGWFLDSMEVVSAVGAGALYWALFGALCAWLAATGRRRLAVFAAVAPLGSLVLNRLVKEAVDRARPMPDDPVAQADGLSFPSGHAQSAAVACLVLLIVAWPFLGRPARAAAAAGAAAYVALMAFSRVALGVHYVSDVCAGVVLGIAWVAAMAAWLDTWPQRG